MMIIITMNVVSLDSGRRRVCQPPFPPKTLTECVVRRHVGGLFARRRGKKEERKERQNRREKKIPSKVTPSKRFFCLCAKFYF